MTKLTDEERDNILITMNENIKVINHRVTNIETRLGDVESRLGNVEVELTKKPNREELAKKPDREEVRQIVREEVEQALSTDTYRFVKVR